MRFFALNRALRGRDAPKDTPPGGPVGPSCPSQPAGNANEQKITHLGDAPPARGLLPFANSGPGGGK